MIFGGPKRCMEGEGAIAEERIGIERGEGQEGTGETWGWDFPVLGGRGIAGGLGGFKIGRSRHPREHCGTSTTRWD